jgi:hypothetical protein
VNIKIAGKWMFIPLKMVLIGIDPSPFEMGKLWMILPRKHAGMRRLGFDQMFG